MRILVAIPHAFVPQPEAPLYGSESGNAARRSAALLRCVSALHQTFGANHRIVGPDDPAANTGNVRLTIAVCTTGAAHLMDSLPPGLVHHVGTSQHPRLLGFECHELLRRNLGSFDWYCYVEDDVEVTDGLFFDKLSWFNASFGAGVMLQPNRYELSTGPVPKLYVDGALTDATVTQPFQDITVRPRLLAPVFNRTFEFVRTGNPHSGSFFADAAQMALMASHPEFGRHTNAFVGPLESAATLMLMRCFDVYKPAPSNASFLEVRHCDERLLDHRVRYSIEAGKLLKAVLGG